MAWFQGTLNLEDWWSTIPISAKERAPFHFTPTFRRVTSFKLLEQWPTQIKCWHTPNATCIQQAFWGQLLPIMDELFGWIHELLAQLAWSWTHVCTMQAPSKWEWISLHCRQRSRKTHHVASNVARREGLSKEWPWNVKVSIWVWEFHKLLKSHAWNDKTHS